MRQYVETVFNDRIYGITATYTAPQHNDRLGQCEYLSFQALIMSVGGTNTTLTVGYETSNDQLNWIGSTGNIINAVDITGANKTHSGTLTQTNGLGAMRLKISLGGTTPVEAHVAIIACGRTAG
ncbi:MAG: hypothetical protein HY744_26320 [Deltaproteobacteria bacterium]|nr:hypothetical protein [Deltaproteobacteria bacterium]